MNFFDFSIPHELFDCMECMIYHLRALLFAVDMYDMLLENCCMICHLKTLLSAVECMICYVMYDMSFKNTTICCFRNYYKMTTFLKCKTNTNNERRKFKAMVNFFKQKEDFFKELFEWNKEKLNETLQSIELKEIKLYCTKGKFLDEMCVGMYLGTNKKIDACDMVEIFKEIYGDIFKELQNENKMNIERITFSI